MGPVKGLPEVPECRKEASTPGPRKANWPVNQVPGRQWGNGALVVKPHRVFILFAGRTATPWAPRRAKRAARQPPPDSTNHFGGPAGIVFLPQRWLCPRPGRRSTSQNLRPSRKAPARPPSANGGGFVTFWLNLRGANHLVTVAGRDQATLATSTLPRESRPRRTARLLPR